jgi:hypothetical protein
VSIYLSTTGPDELHLFAKELQMLFKIQYAALTIALFVAIALCLEKRAYAYVDPGSSLLLCQSASALFAGAVFYFRRRVKALFSRAGDAKTPPPKQSL